MNVSTTAGCNDVFLLEVKEAATLCSCLWRRFADVSGVVRTMEMAACGRAPDDVAYMNAEYRLLGHGKFV